MIKKIISSHVDKLALISRLIIGGIFVFSGWMKIADIQMTIGFFSSLHIPVFLTYIVAYGEFIAGILLLLGIYFEYATLFLIIVMIVATYITRSSPNGFMTPLATLAALIALLGLGSGKYSISKLFKKIN
jgi:putative oxidoreductase